MHTGFQRKDQIKWHHITHRPKNLTHFYALCINYTHCSHPFDFFFLHKWGTLKVRPVALQTTMTPTPVTMTLMTTITDKACLQRLWLSHIKWAISKKTSIYFHEINESPILCFFSRDNGKIKFLFSRSESLENCQFLHFTLKHL